MPTTAPTYRPEPSCCLTSGGRTGLIFAPPTGRERLSIFCSGEKLADELRGASASPICGWRRRAVRSAAASYQIH